MMQPALRIGAVVAVLALGLVVKAGRYGHDQAGARDLAIQRVEAVMAARGWRSGEKIELDGGVLEQISFRRDDCAEPIVVALLGGNAEGHEFFRRRHGGDVMLVQGGDVVERPSGVRRQVETFATEAGAWIGLGMRPVMPVLAISPAADMQGSGCRGPARDDWRGAWARSRS